MQTSSEKIHHAGKADTASAKLIALTAQRGMSEDTFAQMMRMLGERRTGLVTHDNLLGSYAETVEESIFTTGPAPPPDCLTCGACCSYFHQIAVLKTDSTPRALTWQVGETEAPGAGLYWMRRGPQTGDCVAFNGAVGESTCCTIYELRPKSCREFEAGSDRCHAVRRLYGLEPPLSLRQKREHARLLDIQEERDSDPADAASDAAGLASPPETINLLRDSLAYHCEKIDEVLEEIHRLQRLFDDKGLTVQKMRSAMALKTVSKDAERIAELRAQLDRFGNITDSGQEELSHLTRSLLEVSIAAQYAFERASERVARLGGIAFRALGMSLRSE